MLGATQAGSLSLESSQQQSKGNSFTSILQMRKQKLCEFKVMERALTDLSVWLQSPGPLQDTLPSGSSLQALANSGAVISLELPWSFRADFALTNSACSFVYNFVISFTFHKCRPSGCHISSTLCFMSSGF